MSLNSTGVPLLPDSEKFDGTGYSGFKTKILALAKARGLGGYLDGTIHKPTASTTGGTAQTTVLPPDPTSLYSLTPSYDEWIHRDAFAMALLILNVKNPVGLGLKVDGTAADAMQSLEDNHNKITEMGLINALRNIHTAYLVPGTPLSEHVSRLRTLWQVANDMGAKIDDATFRTIFISLLGEEWDNVVPVLHTFKTSSEVISFVTMHAERLNRVPSTSTTALTASTYDHRDARRAARKNLMCSNPQCGAPGRKGHTIADCFWPGGGKEGQWPSWWKGKRPTAVTNHVETFAFTAWTMPEAIVNVYDGTGVQAINFRGEDVLASPETLMSWNEAVDATMTVHLPEKNETVLTAYPGPSSNSFEFLDMSIFSSEFDFLDSAMPPLQRVEDDSDEQEDYPAVIAPYPEARAAPQIAAEAFLQHGQPYPGDDHIQEGRFLVYQTSEMEHIVMDSMIDEDVPILSALICDKNFDIIAWYAAHRRRVLGLPFEDDDLSDDLSERSNGSDSDSDGPDGPCGSVSAFVAEAQPGRKYVVVLDSGATEHCFWSRDDFTEYNPVQSREGNAAEGSKFRILGTGVVRKVITYQGQKKEVSLDAIHTPDITTNLISISKLDARGYIVEFGRGRAVLKRADGSPFMEATLSGGMYRVEFEESDVTAAVAKSRELPADKETWHRRLGHIGNTGLDVLISGMHVNGLHVRKGDMDGLCEDCIFGKQTRRPFDGIHKVEKEVGERVYMDLWGPAQVMSIGGKCWLFHIVDGHSAGVWAYYLAHKSAEETLAAFKLFKAELEKQTNKKLKIIRVDGGGEWINHLWRSFCGAEGILIEVTTPHSSSQNGPGERGIRTTVEFSRCLLADSGLPKSFWTLTTDAAIYLQWFHLKRRNGGKTPHEAYYCKKPDISHLRAFGSTAYAKFVPIKAAGGKLNPRSVKAIMVGYNGSAGYRLWNAAEHKLFNSRDVVFEEGLGHRTRPPAGGDVELAGGDEQDVPVPIPEPDTAAAAPAPNAADIPTAAENIPAPAPVAPRRSTRTRVPSKAIQDSLEFQATEAAAKAAGADWATARKTPNSRTWAAAAFTISTPSTPRNYREAMQHPEVWMAPMEKEYGSLVGREVWTLVDLPPGANVIDCKWVYAVKYDINGDIIKWKARLVAKGFMQIPGVDFFETYAGVVRYESLRMLWAICVNEPGWVMWAMDVVSAYLNSEMKEVVYMRQPEGFVVPGQEGKVCLMKRSLYGMMQSGRNWAEHLESSLAALGWVRSRADPSIRIRSSDAGTSIIGVYTDDLDGISSTTAAADEAQVGIKSIYDVTDVPRTATSLGMTVEYDEVVGTISISSRPYLERVLARYGMSDCNPKSTPLAVGIELTASQSPSSPAEHAFMADKPYREAVGSIQHAANTTRPDIVYSVNRLAAFLQNPGPAHWKAVQHLLAYISGTLEYKITYRRGTQTGICPLGWVDADYGADLDTRRSTSGEIFMMSGGPVSWSSKKQATVALSTTEAEYVALTRSSKQAMWMYSFLDELCMPQQRPAVLYGDNLGAAALARDAKGHARVKHIDIREHYIRERIAAGDIKIQHVTSSENLADIFTKVLPRDAHLAIVRALGLTH